MPTVKLLLFASVDCQLLTAGCLQVSYPNLQVVGKPSPAFFQLALSSLGVKGLQAGQVVMVGDDWRDDILGEGLLYSQAVVLGVWTLVSGAQEAGLQGALVKTGKYQEGDEEREEGGRRVEQVFPSLLEVVHWLLGQRGSQT